MINSLCDEAVDRIFKILDHAAAGPGLKDPPDSGRIHKGEANKRLHAQVWTYDLRLQFFHLSGGNTEEKSYSSTEKTVILVYNQVSGAPLYLHRNKRLNADAFSGF